jgi:hypothetical protein
MANFVLLELKGKGPMLTESSVLEGFGRVKQL